MYTAGTLEFVHRWSFQDEEARERLIDLVKQAAESEAFRQLSSLERNVLGLYLDQTSNITNGALASRLGVSGPFVSVVKYRAFIKLFRDENQTTRDEVQALMIVTGIGSKVIFPAESEVEESEPRWNFMKDDQNKGQLSLFT